MVTPFEALAKAFSHKPTLLSFSDDMQSAMHDGQIPGYLYVVSEPVTPADIRVHPGTRDTHWEIQRDLKVDLVGEVPVSDPPQLTGAALEEVRQKHAAASGGVGFLES